MASKRRAIAELTADDRGLQRGLARAEKRMGAFRKMTTKGFKALGSVAAGVTGGILGGGAIGVGAMFANEASKTMDFERDLTRLGITAGSAIGNLDAFREKVFAVSTATGVAREEVLRSASAFVALTGDGATAAASMELFAKISKGTGASMDDIAASAAAMTQNLKIGPAEFEKAFSILIAGGKAGSVELKDMATLLAGLAPQAARFRDGLGTEGLSDLAAALQLARQGFGTAEEAATGLEALMGSLAQHAGKFEAAGAKIFNVGKDGTKSLRSLPEIVESIGNSKLMKDPTKLAKAFGRKEAQRAFEQLVKVKGAWGALAEQTMAAQDVAEDYATFSKSASGRMEASWNGVKNRIAEAFTTDRIEAFGAALIKVIEVAAGVVTAIGDIAGALDRYLGVDNASLGSGPATTAANKGVRAVVPVERSEEAMKENFFSTGAAPIWKRKGIVDSAKDLWDGGWGESEFLLSDKLNTDVHRTPDERAALAGGPAVDPKTHRAPQAVQVRVTMDPSTTNLKGQIDDSRGHAR